MNLSRHCVYYVDITNTVNKSFSKNTRFLLVQLTVIKASSLNFTHMCLTQKSINTVMKRF